MDRHGFERAVLLFTTGAVFAQQTSVGGRVPDSSGAVMPQVAVAAVDAAGARASTVTNNDGVYQFPALRAAEYRLRFEAPGFSPAEKTLTLLVGQSLTIDIAMTPATSTSIVNVVGDTAVVETAASQVGDNVTSAEMKTIPLNGRNWMELSCRRKMIMSYLSKVEMSY